MRNCAERFARPASTPKAGEMGETTSALTVNAKVFAAYLPPDSHGESFWLTASVCTCQQQAQSRWEACMYHVYLYRYVYWSNYVGFGLRV